MKYTNTEGGSSRISPREFRDGQRSYTDFSSDHGRVQIVEIAEGECQVGYLPHKAGSGWRHWGKGQGGYLATVKRFQDCSTFNPRGN